MIVACSFRQPTCRPSLRFAPTTPLFYLREAPPHTTSLPSSLRNSSSNMTASRKSRWCVADGSRIYHFLWRVLTWFSPYFCYFLIISNANLERERRKLIFPLFGREIYFRKENNQDYTNQAKGSKIHVGRNCTSTNRTKDGRWYGRKHPYQAPAASPHL